MMISTDFSSTPHSAKRKRVVASCSECYRRKQKCDRKSPCSNCTARKVPTKCVFNDPSPTTQAGDPIPTGYPQETIEERIPGSADLGYSLVSGSNTFVGLQEIFGNEEFAHVTSSYNASPRFIQLQKDAEMLIAKLPARTTLEALVEFFFSDVNWHYFILEKLYFDDLFSRWPPAEEVDAVSYLETTELSNELRYFPALLCQVIALSLQFLPPGGDVLDKVSQREISTSKMYSDLGDELLSLLGRPGFALTAIQADFLRSSWLKNCGRGVQSWHAVGYAIREAQELGLHRQKQIHQASETNLGKTLSLFWYEENKKRLWINLFVWDSFMAMLLGRPRMIHLEDCDVKPPMNCNIPRDPSTAIPMAMRPGDDNSITNISAPLFRYELACKVHEMRALKADRSRPKDYSVVRMLHEKIISLLDELPAFLRLNNSDTTWDLVYPYLPQLRQELKVMANLFLMTLHRPHIISNMESRRAALQAALETLDAQQCFFEHAKPHHYHLFGLSFYTVDASFLVCIIAILFPPRNLETEQRVDQNVQRAINSLSDMKDYNPIAKSGLDILQRCYQKLKITSKSHSNVPPESRTASYGTPSDELHDLMRDLGQPAFDSFANSQVDPSPSNSTPGLGHSTHFSESFQNSFNQTYWLDQLNMIQPSFSNQDEGYLWNNIYFD